MLPKHILDSIHFYVETGKCGHCIEAIASNNLVNVVGRADSEYEKHLFEIVRYFYNKLPSDCWGSAEKVKEYRKKLNSQLDS